MRTVLWSSVRVYARRYVATIVAVLVGVAFVVSVDALTNATRNGLLSDLSSEYAGASTIVTEIPDNAAANTLLGKLSDASVNATTYQPIAARHQRLTEGASIGTVAADRSLRWQKLVEGRFPSRPGEAVVDLHTAHSNKIHVGDRLRIGEGGSAAGVTVSGLVGSSSGPLSAPVYLTWPGLETAFGDQASVTNLVVHGGSVAAVRSATPSGLQVQSATTYLQDLQKQASRGVDVVAIVLLVFATIAFFVAALVIANTFAILLAQRSREFALLRCVGATRRQVRRSVLVEAVVIGVGASTVGVLAGIGIGAGLLAIGRAAFDNLPLGGLSLSPWWVAGAWVLGVLVTAGSALVPALRGTRVSPLAALRSDAPVEARSRAGAVRIGLAVVTELAGVALLVMAMSAHNVAVMLVGGMVSFIGVLMAGPVLVPLLVRALGLLAGRFGVTGRLAAGNAVRNPRRTAATTSALLVGVTLITGLVVGMATIRSAVNRELDKDYPVDFEVVTARTLPSDTLSRARATEDVRDAVSLDGTDVRITQGRRSVDAMPVLAVDDEARSVLHTGSGLLSRAGVVAVPWDTLAAGQFDLGKPVVLHHGSRQVTLRVTGTDASTAALVRPGVVDRLTGGDATARAVWVRADDGAKAADVRSALAPVGWSVRAEVNGGLPQRDNVTLQLDVMTGAILTLLGVGAAIALVGIGSTLGLSVLERSRENAVLRALGLTRRQLRATLATEALLLAGVAGLLGVALGACYAWIGVRTIAGQVLEDTSVSWPVGQLVALVLAATLAGLVASGLPARRAAKVTPAAGLTAD